MRSSEHGIVIVFKRMLRRRYFWEAGVAIVLLALGYTVGGARYGPVVVKGARATGTVVGYETVTNRRARRHGNRTHRLPRTTHQPLVEFQVEGRTIRFRNRWGSEVAPTRGETVNILYDPADPSIALIDQPRMWIPWAPFLVAGTFMALVALRGWVMSRRS